MSNNFVALVICQANKLYFDNNKKRKLNESLMDLIAVYKGRERHKRARVLGYVDLVDNYLEDDFKSHFRMTRVTMELLITQIGNEMVKTRASTGRPQENIKLQCLICIWVLANQESYRSIGDRFNVAKSTVFHCISRISTALNKLANNIIKWPEGNEALAIIDGFQRKKNVPGVLGAVDGSHIDIKAPKHNSSSYLNRKGSTSMILQGVCDNSCMFIDVFVGFPGSVHDARVFMKSGLLRRCSEDQHFPHNSHLLGDSAYPLGKHILVPFKDNGHLSRNQIKFNIAHATTRVVIERAYGILKGRWRRLRYLELHDTDLLPDVIMATCVLHNFCIKHSDELPDAEIEQNNIVQNEYLINNVNIENRNDGVRKRDFIMNSL